MDVNMLMSALIAFTEGLSGSKNLVVPQLCVALQRQRACGITVHVRAAITRAPEDEMHTPT